MNSPTIITLISILLLSLWLIPRALTYLQNNAQNAALLAQLEAMDADLTRLEVQSLQSGRELQKLDRIQKPKKPQPEPKEPRAQFSAAEEQPAIPQISSATPPPAPSAPPRETAILNPKRKRANKPALPKTIEEFEATRKRLPPAPVYIPNANAVERFNELYNIPPQPTPTNIRVKSPVSAVETPLRTMPSLINLCLAPIRIASRCLSVIIVPVLRISKIFTSFFTRPKPPPRSNPASFGQKIAA